MTSGFLAILGRLSLLQDDQDILLCFPPQENFKFHFHTEIFDSFKI